VVGFPEEVRKPFASRPRAVWWWIDRWRKSTAFTDMTLEEQGAYRNLLDEVWMRPGGVIPDESIAKVSGDALRWKKIGPKVLRWMVRVPGGWTNDTAQEVQRQSLEYRAQQRERGRKRAAEASRTPTGAFQPAQPDTQPDTQPRIQPESQPSVQPRSQPPSPSPSLRKEKDSDPERGPGPLEGPAAPERSPEVPNFHPESNPFGAVLRRALPGPGVSDLTREEIAERKGEALRKIAEWQPARAKA
jgi:uncharacterized protein YdaU (DUF1376 family)